MIIIVGFLPSELKSFGMYFIKVQIKKIRKVLKPNIACQTQLSGLQFKVICALAGPEPLDH